MITQQNDSRYSLHAGWYKMLATQAKASNIDITKFESFRSVQINSQGEYDIRSLRALHMEIIEHHQDFKVSIQAVQHVTPFTFGCYSVALSTCRSLYDFLNIACDNFIYIAPQMQLSINQNNKKVELIFIENHSPVASRVTKPGHIIVICTLLEMMRNLNGMKAVPVELHAPNLDYKEHEKDYFQQRYNCQKITQKTMIKLTFNKIDLLPLLSNYNAEVHQHNLNYVSKRVVKLSKHDIRLQVCSIFDQYESLKDININSVAEQLLTSTRTLNRRLANVDTNFTNTLNCYRQEKAIRLLKNPEINMTEITYQLGFSELSSFSRAFRHWTGDCPTKRRRQSINI
jgi:AraC-like DNA-binding protein